MSGRPLYWGTIVTDSLNTTPINLPTINVGVYRPGDINGDGEVNIQDLMMLQKAALHELSLSAPQMVRADLYPAGGDGQLSVTDIMTLQNILLGL
jgi:hypothetical protein